MAILENLSEQVWAGNDVSVAVSEEFLIKACVEVFTSAEIMATAFPSRVVGLGVRCGDEGWLQRIVPFLGQCLEADLDNNGDARMCATRGLALLFAVLPSTLPPAIKTSGCIGLLCNGLRHSNIEIRKVCLPSWLGTPTKPYGAAALADQRLTLASIGINRSTPCNVRHQNIRRGRLSRPCFTAVRAVVCRPCNIAATMGCRVADRYRRRQIPNSQKALRSKQPRPVSVLKHPVANGFLLTKDPAAAIVSWQLPGSQVRLYSQSVQPRSFPRSSPRGRPSRKSSCLNPGLGDMDKNPSPRRPREALCLKPPGWPPP